MMRVPEIILFLSILVYSCNTAKKVTTTGDRLLVSMQRTECRGKCPVYSISIYQDGRIIYTGTKNVERIGTYEKQLSKAEMMKIKKAFSKSNYFGFNDEYTSRITDLPTTYISFTEEERTKKIRDYHGSPSELKELENMIENIAINSTEWSRQ